jgi:integrase
MQTSNQRVINPAPLRRAINYWFRTFTVARRGNGEDAATFCFADDIWPLQNLLRPHERNGSATLVFSDVPAWLRNDAKRFIAHLWLETNAEANLLQTIIVTIRLLGRLLPDFQGRPIDLRMSHARELTRRIHELNYSPSYNQHIQKALNRFATFVRQQNPEEMANDFQVVFSKEMIHVPQFEPFEESRDKVIPTEIQTTLIEACLSDIRTYLNARKIYVDPVENLALYERERSRRRREGEQVNLVVGHRVSLQHLLGRAVKATALILANCVGRRAAAVCNTRQGVRTETVEWLNESGQMERGVMVRFKEFKISDADEDVFCPDALGELALYAIETAKDLTTELRRNSPEWGEYLFLTPTKRRKKAQVLSPKQMNDYINGIPGQTKGILYRYNIPSDRITTHAFRRTRATKAWIGGMQIHEIAHDLGHVDGQSTMRHYVIGNEESKRRFQTLMDHGSLSGALVDFIGGTELVQTHLGKRHVESMRKQGMLVSPTRYGYCALFGSGPCTRTIPCYLGPAVNSGGCDHHLLSPDALSALEEDKEVLEASISMYEADPEYHAWVLNQRNHLAVVNRTIERAHQLQARETDCGDSGDCACKDK